MSGDVSSSNAPPNVGQPPDTGGGDTASKVPVRESSNTIKIEPLNKTNWTIWREWMTSALSLCGLEGYAEGTIKCPADTLKAKSWDFNDQPECTQFIIMNNITNSKMVHVGKWTTAEKMLQNLQAVHETKSHFAAIANI
jgi:hypothetical protein